MIGHLARGNFPALMVTMTSYSKRKRGSPPVTLENMLPNDLSNIAKITSIDGTNVFDESKKMKTRTHINMFQRERECMIIFIFIITPNEYINIYCTYLCIYFYSYNITCK